MNIFVLDTIPEKAAKYHCDKHLVKMILESAQMMCTVLHKQGNENVPYRASHRNHPCTIWLGESLSNWVWLQDLSYHMNNEYKKRYKHTKNHKSWSVIDSLPMPDIADKGLTPFVQVMPEKYLNKNAVEAYRNYYKEEKSAILTYKNSEKPFWI